MMNSLEWLPVYFGILKTGAIAVPLNYRYTEDEIKFLTCHFGSCFRGIP
ncbi:MAG TPA: AMP-binding protein [Syntrophales bacterium]|nr:AMP-binding protein [Syntrophales bacterium]HPX82629.1 AMP-binding protein [Syntrophales bacterium]